MNITSINVKKVITKKMVLAAVWLISPLLLTGTVSAQTDFFDYPDITLDIVESTSGWRSHSTMTLDTGDYKSGTASLKSVGSGKDRFRKTFAAPLDVSNMRYLTFWYYVNDPKKLGGSNKGQIEIGSAGTYDTEEQNWSVHELHLIKGWQLVVVDLPGKHRSKTNVPTDLTRINWFRIYHDPTASITTRIDDIRFTNRDPRSAAFSYFLEKKRLSKNILQASWIDDFYSMVYETDFNDGERQQLCRKLEIEHASREVSRYSLEKMGIDPVVARSGGNGKKTMMQTVCSPGKPHPDILVHSLQQAMGYEVTLNSAVMNLYDISSEAAAELMERIQELDISRIYQACGTRGEEIDSYIETGAIPAGIVGPNVLFRNCDVNSGSMFDDIALRIGSRDPFINNRAFTFRQCMKDFQDQASECSNPYANQDDDDLRRRIYNNDHYSTEEKETAIQYMADWVKRIDAIQFSDAYSETPEGVPKRYSDLMDPTAPTQGAQNYEYSQELHRQYNNGRARLHALRNTKRDLNWLRSQGEDYADLQPIIDRVHAKEKEVEEEQQELRDRICYEDPENPICENYTPGKSTPDPDEPLPELARCAEMDIGGGYSAFYNKPPGVSGFSRQLNEGDRINHCLCDLFDKDYSELPQFAMVGSGRINSFCPDPNERVMHECTQPGWNDGPPSPNCVLQGLVSRDLNETELPSRICWAMQSPECPNPELDGLGNCSCFEQPSDPVDTTPLVGNCANALRCLDGSAPVFNGMSCGCTSIDPQPGVCVDNILTPNDRAVSVFPGLPDLGEWPVISTRGNDPLITRAVSRAELTNGNRLDVSVFNAFDTGPLTAQAETRCTNLNTGVSNYLVDRVSLSNFDSGAVSNMAFAFSDADIDQCFGGEQQGRAAHLELSVRTLEPVPAVGFIANGNLANIFGPDMPEQPCVTIINGPTPRPWNMSDGRVIRNDLATVFPVMSDGIIFLPHTVVEPVVFSKDYAPSSLDIFDDSSAPAISTLNVTRQGPTGMLTLHLHLRGNWLAGRFLVTLTAPDGTEVHEVFGLGVPEEGEAEEVYDGGMILRLDELDYTIDSEGPWTLEVRDLGGSESGRKSGDLYSWSLNFNAVEEWEAGL